MIKNCLSFSFIVFTFCGLLYAQEAVPFKVQNEFYIYGDATVIGNNILSKDVKEPFNDTSLTNDDIDMVFVDIDNDPSTFSSSSASLKLPENHKKIVYAALYWTATYSYEQGYKQESNGQFLFQGKRVTKRDDIDDIMLKLPNGEYKNINGTVIFDGDQDTDFALNSPYVCVADVTRLLKNTKSVNGDYTVANVKATKGFVAGGSAAGWLLYVVYETPTKNPKYITTFNGFAHVSNAPLKIKFNNFKALEKGEIKTKLTFAALEGDSALTEDECLLVNRKSKRVSLLRTESRPKNNFFNSKITDSDNILSNRYPKSENTLGFDIVSMDVPNESEPIIDNTTTEIEMAFNTESDRFYMFFTAFQTEISKIFYEEKTSNIVEETIEIDKTKSVVLEVEKPKEEKKKRKKPIQKERIKKEKKKQIKVPATAVQVKVERTKTPVSIIQDVYTPKEELYKVENYTPVLEKKKKPLPIWLQKNQPDEILSDLETGVYQPNVTLKQPIFSNNSLVMNRENYEKLLTKEDYVYETQKFKRILNQEPALIDGVTKGYYVIAGLLYDLDYAISYQEELKDQGVNSKLFKDVSQGKYYIYLYNSENFYDVFMLRKAFIKSIFLKQVWILNINIEKQVIKKL
ncbi:hypothetical protein [Lacinutrix sp. Bg11-31]|uniref:hypothetical protein n=1 Tax=Lacinutrix sp. Bg11-31 TaxID=2057808 RepID=UPI000C30CDF4|nr:hypothetical protein [Lacinutrix sp. Bg11-31]AUC82971.1 hypothetical protein CW733_12880 [Lacinutrix sp. Bg11-31]